MNAQQAKELALNAKAKEGDLTEIRKRIQTFAAQGDMFIWWYKDMSELVEKTLSDEGYKVTLHFDRNETLYKISWG